MESEQLEDSGGRRAVAVVTRWMGDERRSGASLFIPYRSNDSGPKVSANIYGRRYDTLVHLGSHTIRNFGDANVVVSLTHIGLVSRVCIK